MWKLGKRSKMDIKIQNFEKFLNLNSDLKRKIFETPSLPKKTKKIQPEVWKLRKRSKLDIKIQHFEKFLNVSSDFNRTTFETPSLPKKNKENPTRCVEGREKVKSGH